MLIDSVLYTARSKTYHIHGLDLGYTIISTCSYDGDERTYLPASRAASRLVLPWSLMVTWSDRRVCRVPRAWKVVELIKVSVALAVLFTTQLGRERALVQL